MHKFHCPVSTSCVLLCDSFFVIIVNRTRVVINAQLPVICKNTTTTYSTQFMVALFFPAIFFIFFLLLRMGRPPPVLYSQKGSLPNLMTNAAKRSPRRACAQPTAFVQRPPPAPPPRVFYCHACTVQYSDTSDLVRRSHPWTLWSE